MATLNPYLNFNGNAEQAFTHYKSVFGGEFAMVMRFKDVKDAPAHDDSESEKLMHIALPINQNSVLMGSDVPGHYPPVTFGSNFAISVSAESEAEADRFFAGLSEGGKILMPLEKTFWGAYFGMCMDQFSVSWMVSFDQNPR